VQGLVAIPHPARDSALVGLAHAPAQRVVGETDYAPIGPHHLRQVPSRVPGVGPLLAPGRGLVAQIAQRIIGVARALGLEQLPRQTVAPFLAVSPGEEVA
jgi:hypothetical protein